MKVGKIRIEFLPITKLRFILIFPIIIILVCLLLSSLLLPYFETRLMVKPFELIGGILSGICHQYPSRSFYIFGSNVGLCARCFSTYFAILLFSIAYLFVSIKIGWIRCLIIGLTLCVPLFVDGFTQYCHVRNSTNLIRTVTGLMAGVGIAIIIIPYYVRLGINCFNSLLKNSSREKEEIIMKNLSIKITTMLIIVSFGIFAMDAICYSKEIVIKAGTPIPVRITDAVSSENATVGQTVSFTVTRNVEVDDIVVIKAGSEVIGEITFAQKTGSLGKEGKLSLNVRYAIAVDNTRVPLRCNLSKTGDEKLAEAIIICPFIKGEATHIEAGTEFKAYVDYDTKVNI